MEQRYSVPLHEPWASGSSIAQRLLAAGHETWFVGGCVRDLLVHREVHDVDLATAALPDQVEALAAAAGLIALTVGKAFGVVVVVAPSGRHVEVATFRNDRQYIDGRRPAGIDYATVDEDVARRDFTINALLLHPHTGELRDLVGGHADLAAGVVRAVGDAAARLREDRLRVLRGLRFAAHLGLRIEPATWSAMQTTPLHGLSGERMAQEWDKALIAPYRGAWLRLIAGAGRLGEVCPPLPADCAAIAQALDRLPAAAPPALVDAVALSATVRAVGLAWHSAQPLPTLRIQTVRWLLGLLDELDTWPGLRPSQRAQRLRSGPAALLPELVAAVRPGWPGLAEVQTWSAAPSAQIHWKPQISAGDLMSIGIVAGPLLGQTLARLAAAEIDHPDLTRAQLLAQATAPTEAPRPSPPANRI